MRIIKHGLMRTLFPAIMMANIHWTRLGYTYDWADNGQAYGLSEFIVKQDSDVKVAYTVELGEMIQKLEDNTWNPEAEN